MNSVWLTSPFVKFNTDNLIYNETLCSETHFLNKFARDKYRTEDQNSSTNNERQGNFTVVSNYSSNSNFPSQEGAQDENIEENFTITENGASCLKIDSKIVSRKIKSRSTLSERSVHSQKVTSCSNVTDETANKIREAEIDTELSSINCSSRKKKSQLSANDTIERNIENDLSNCPFELVQIYPGNKENISGLDRTFSDISREGSSLVSFPKEAKKSSKSRVAENDGHPLTKAKCGQANEAGEHHRLVETASNRQCRNESKAVEDVEERERTFKLSIVRDIDSTTSSDSEKSCLTAKGKKCSSTERSRRVLKRSEELMNYLDHDRKKMDFAIVNDSKTSRSRKSCAEYDDTRSFVCESEKTLMEDLIGMKEERKDEEISSLLEAETCSNDLFDKYHNESNEDNIEKSRCDPTSVTNSSDIDFSQRNSTVLDTNRRKLDSDMESINLKEKQSVSENMEEGKNIMNNIETMRVNDRQNGGNRTGERKITEYAIDDASNGMIEKSASFSLDYGNIKICNLLSKIHEQLYNNFQKMESIWILLQDTSPIDSVRPAMPLRLLVRIISRCKSYIHDSHDSCKAESKIAKCLLSLVIDLAKAVDQNKLVLEKQELQLDNLLLKLYQEKNLYRKRIMINDVISVWDHGLREISDIMQEISDKLRTDITESEERENVRNPSFRRKDGVVESSGPKASLMRKESNIETQMSVTLNKHNTIKSPKAKTAAKFANTQRHQDVEKLSYIEPVKIVERKMNDSISLSRYNATKHPKSKTSTKSLNIQRYQDVERLSYNEPVKNFEKKMNDSISLSRYNATKHPKSKTSTKSLNIQRCHDIEKLSVVDLVKIVERKINDNVRYSEKGKLLKKPTQSVNFEQSRLPMSRQKYRVANSPQPVWRPGGVVKLPSSRSATTLALKNRPLLAQASDRANQLTDNIKEGKHGRTGEIKKKISTDANLAKYRVPNLPIDTSKQSSRKYIPNPESTSKLKPKSRPLKVCFKEENGSFCRSESTCSERTLPERVNRQKTSKEAKVLKLLEEIIKSAPADRREKRNANKPVVGDHQNETNSIDLERSMNPISIEEEMEIPQDEPTRDIDPNEVCKSEQLIEKIPECPLTVIPPIDFSSSTTIKDQAMDSKLSVHLENSRSQNNSNFTCATELEPSPNYTAEIESSNSHQTSASFASQKRQKDELTTPRDSARVKPERQKVSSSINVSSNSHTMSLTMLKEFLRDQGVDVNLLNKAEQCMKDKRKCRGCLKAKSASLVDVMSFNKVQRGKCSTESSCCQGDTAKEVVRSCERNFEGLVDAMKSVDQNFKDNLKLPVPKTKDTSMCTVTDNKDSSVQTNLRETQTKGIQMIIEEDTPRETETIETQTEMISIKHTATDCCRQVAEELAGKSNLTDASSMTESTSVKDSITETVQVSYTSKLIATEQSKSNLKKVISDHRDKNATKFVEIWNALNSEKMRIQDDRELTEKHCYLNRLNLSEKALMREKNCGGCKLGFCNSDSSTSSCCSQFPECSEHSNCCAMIDPESNNFDKVISLETITTLQSAAIRARNMYRTIYMYQQHMESKLKEEEEKLKFEKTEKCEQSKDLSTIDSIDIIVKDSYHSCKYDVEILSRAEIASLSDESEYEISESASMPITTVSQNERDASDEGDLEVCKKLSSGDVLKVVKSLMELTIQKMDDVKMTEIDCVRTVSSRTCSKIHIEFSKKENRKNEHSISPFSRQNLLMLVYGVVCSIVFWCLQFTITCDVVL